DVLTTENDLEDKPKDVTFEALEDVISDDEPQKIESETPSQSTTNQTCQQEIPQENTASEDACHAGLEALKNS
ncbi:MFS transporter, partial [Vibrio sp. 10N.261.45.F1]